VSARWEAWRRRFGLWLPAVGFFALNVVALAVFRLNFAGESAGLERRLADREAQLATARAERERLAELAGRAEANRDLVAGLYRERFATRQQRLTRLTEEVKELARRAGLSPQSISYPEDPIEEFAVVERAFVFTVQGSYEELRAFLNFLELSPSFVSVKEVGLAGSRAGSAGLTISLRLATLFSQDGPQAPLAGGGASL
jgi:hypothetical protein